MGPYLGCLFAYLLTLNRSGIIQFLLYYILSTLALAVIDAVRIRLVTPQKKRNIRKWISNVLAVVAALAVWQFLDRPTIAGCIVIAIGVRWAIFDPFLNVLRGFAVDYESESTNSKVDQKERQFGLSFWAQRLCGAVLAAAPFLIELIKNI